ncbi:type II toxin-antitoxin system RatA family toxin [uncultured Psychrosphaera sp.]|jgi:ribosome-associated toxin RatA of RatAB toxin-antitoxin module|uniref:type II toxin-antitoxin system RatA family toxin n=1 Tax=uncultured Psychrosphaera sp. TaxID=1403522 RepID=UPI00261FEE24|nr:type II toxin-antitoxin system RatA family toxin [uncultured Psychrosphaera sp.]
MANISRSALVMYSCEQMYKLVDDIELYPQFIPNCADSKRIQINENTVEGSLLISSVGISKWFTTQNELTANKEIKMQLLNGPFKHLTGVWKFTELDQFACKVELDLEFEFSSKMIELAFGGIFNNLVANMVSAFTQRAKKVYE